MSPKPDSILISEGISLDALTGRMTLFNILDRIYARDLPAGLARMTIVLTYSLSEEEVALDERIRILSPSSHPVRESSAHLVLRARNEETGPSHRSIHSVWGLRLDEAGDYRVEVEHRDEGGDGWHSVAATAFEVCRADHPLFPPRDPEDEG